MNKEDAAWLAGVMSIQGVFQKIPITRKKKAGREFGFRYTLSSNKQVEVVERVAQITGWEIRLPKKNSKETPTVGAWGDSLHEVMKEVWPWLTRARKQEYALVKRASDASTIRPDNAPSG